jgi:POT family proton-dependent oligopeptide transporter
MIGVSQQPSLRPTASMDTTLPLPSILIIVVEFWERFSYYGIIAILVIFLSTATAQGGFGWPLSQALVLLSAFSGLAFISPIAGGIIADRYIGTRRAVTWGAVALTAGNFALVLCVAAPALWDWLTATHVRQALEHSGVPLGLLAPGITERDALAAASTAAAAGKALLFVYRSQSALFYGALSLIILGNAFLKSTLPVLLGQVFDAHGGRSDAAYNYYYMGITLGAVASSLAVGYFGQTYGWAFGFACASLGMLVALLLYTGLGPRMLKSSGLKVREVPDPGVELADPPLPWSHYSVGLSRIAIYGLFLIVFTIGWVQTQGLWLYVLENQVQRKIAGFEVPAPWVIGLYSMLVIVYSPVCAQLSRWIAVQRGAEPSFAARFILGFLALAVSHAVMAVGFSAPKGHLVLLAWPLAAMAVLGIADVVAWPASYGMVQRLSPPRLRGALLGAWIAMLGVGQTCAHLAAAKGEGWGFRNFSAAVAALMAASAVLLWLVDRVMTRFASRKAASR